MQTDVFTFSITETFSDKMNAKLNWKTKADLLIFSFFFFTEINSKATVPLSQNRMFCYFEKLPLIKSFH